MDLKLDLKLAESYKNKSQIARVITESWVGKNSYCPGCGNNYINEFENNRPVADFYCPVCNEEFELKAKCGKFVGKKIVDGAYSTMVERIHSEKNPNFFFLTYDKKNWVVNNFIIIPKHFFISEVIEKRKPLAKKAKRAGWVGCNIDLTKIPESGRIFLIKDSNVIEPEKVQYKWKETLFLKEKKGHDKGWVLDIMNCIDRINDNTFSLSQVYAFEGELKQKYPNNNFIKDKIRQQLQILRDKNIISFEQRGIYKKVN